MSNNGRSNLLIVLALLIGVSGVGLGAYSTFFQVPVAGTPGEDGEDGLDGVDGKDALGGIVVGILDPDVHDMVSGVIEIRALIAGSTQYSISVLRNASEIGTQVPLEWDTTSVADGWWNITVEVIDIPSGNHTQDEVIVYVMNMEEDVPMYYCASEEEINDALTDIGSGSGTITITDDIILTSSIIINGDGSYILQGIAPSITIDCNGDRSAIRIEITQSCIIRDLTIDATDIIGTSINIIFVSDTFSYIENVKIFGDAGRNGRGIYIDCADVWVSNCYITEVLYGIFCSSSAHSTHVSDNTVLYCDDGAQGEGIFLYGDSSTCDNNYVAYCHIGIYVLGDQCTVSNNVLYGNNPYAIRVATDYSTFSGNSIRGLDPNSPYTLYAFYIYTGSDFNVLTGNLIYNYTNAGSGIGYGVRISTSHCDENTIVGNTFLSCETPISDSGTNTYDYYNNIV